MKHGSLYSASDKALFDALAQSAVTQASMRELFLRRGILVSKSTSRKQLAMYFSRLVHDYGDFEMLARIFGTHRHRRERVVTFRVDSDATIDDFERASLAVVDEIGKNGDVASVRRISGSQLQISAKYKKFFFDKNEFKQVVTRTAVINIESIDGTISVSGPQNEDVDKWFRDIINHVEGEVDGDLRIDEVDLLSVPSAKARTQFFVDLINGVEGFEKHDVSDVYVHNRSPVEDDGFESDEEEEDVFISAGVHISRASLKGEGVLDSHEFLSLAKRGFYIYRIIWQAKDSSVDSDIYEFEAQFSEPETCTRFSCLSRGFYKYQGDGLYSKNRQQFTTPEEYSHCKAIEEAAQRSRSLIANSLDGGGEHEI